MEEQSAIVQEIFGKSPHWIIRWGMLLVAAVVLSIFAGAWMISYPEVLDARVVITTSIPPAPVVSQMSGEVNLLVKDREDVEKGMPLAVIRSSASYPAIVALKEGLAEVEQLINDQPGHIKIPEADGSLGEIQGYYDQFYMSLVRYNDYGSSTYYSETAGVLESQLLYYQRLHEQHVHRRDLVEREVALAKEKFDNQKMLAERNVISQLDLAASEQTYLAQIRAFVDAGASLTSISIQEEQQRRALRELRHQGEQEWLSRTAALQNAFQRLRSEMARWERLHVLIAPMDGQVSLFDIWTDNQFVVPGQEVFTIVPASGEGELIGKLRLPIVGAGRIKEGQPVLIRLQSFPHHQFGTLSGNVRSVSLVPREDLLLVEVGVPQDLRTSHRIMLPYTPNMTGQAEIITQDRRLIDRIFSQIKLLLD